VLAQVLALVPDPRVLLDSLLSAVPGDLRHGVSLQLALHHQVVPLLPDRWLVWEPWRHPIRDLWLAGPTTLVESEVDRCLRFPAGVLSHCLVLPCVPGLHVGDLEAAEVVHLLVQLHRHLHPGRLGDHLLAVVPGEGGLGLAGQPALEDDLRPLVRLADHWALGEGWLYSSRWNGSFITVKVETDCCV